MTTPKLAVDHQIARALEVCPDRAPEAHPEWCVARERLRLDLHIADQIGDAAVRASLLTQAMARFVDAVSPELFQLYPERAFGALGITRGTAQNG